MWFMLHLDRQGENSNMVAEMVGGGGGRSDGGGGILYLKSVNGIHLSHILSDRYFKAESHNFFCCFGSNCMR